MERVSDHELSFDDRRSTFQVRTTNHLSTNASKSQEAVLGVPASTVPPHSAGIGERMWRLHGRGARSLSRKRRIRDLQVERPGRTLVGEPVGDRDRVAGISFSSKVPPELGWPHG